MAEGTPLTIGLPVYNGEPYVGAAIESILAQTFGDFVLVVSDNGSTDATEEVARSYAASDDRVEFVRSSENRGAAWNYNRVFAECRTPYFKWAASDDLLAPTCVERCYEALRQAPQEVVLVFPRTRLIDANDEPMGDLDDRLVVLETTPHARLGYVVRHVVWGNPAFGVVRSDVLRRTRGHGNYPSADWVLLAELALYGQFWQVPEPLFLRRFHEGTSRKANTSAREIAHWFDPESSGTENELRRVFREHFGAIKHAPLPSEERLFCYATLVSAWAQRRIDLRSRLQLLLGRDDG
jgi:glycosyltransferase involved in cell wall biosynthesis